MRKCLIVNEAMLFDLIRRYDGIGSTLTNDEKEILLFALYNESDLVKRAQEAYLKKLEEKKKGQ